MVPRPRRSHGLARAALAACLAAAPVAGPASAQGAEVASPWAVTLFSGRMTDNDFDQILTLDDIGWRDAYVAGAALSRELAGTERFGVEAEVQAVRHFGRQDHWEFNAALYGRWKSFPWSDRLRTTAAFGIGPSFATRLPPEERTRSGSTNRILVHWTAELEAGPLDSPWSAVARLHHRSSGFGTVADEGGSNFLAVGVRRRF